MAFGSWFKKIAEKVSKFGQAVKNGVQKVLPWFKKGADVVSDTVAPVIGAIGRQVGGDAGDRLVRIGETAGRLANRAREGAQVIEQYATGGRGADRFNEPLYAPK